MNIAVWECTSFPTALSDVSSPVDSFLRERASRSLRWLLCCPCVLYVYCEIAVFMHCCWLLRCILCAVRVLCDSRFHALYFWLLWCLMCTVQHIREHCYVIGAAACLAKHVFCGNVYVLHRIAFGPLQMDGQLCQTCTSNSNHICCVWAIEETSRHPQPLKSHKNKKHL